MRLIARVGLAGVLGVVALGGSWNAISAQAPAASMYGEMRWRMIGPFRGGRTKAAAGVPSRPGLFYIGVNNGGVWKTTDYGRIWTPIFDDQPTGSIGALAVAPSDPEHHLRRQRRRPAASRPVDRRRHLQVDRRRARPGRTSACATASRFRRSSSIRTIRTALFVAVLGHPYGPNEERGIFRSTDGGTYVPEGALQGREHRRRRRASSIRRIRQTSTPCCGRRARGRGRTASSRARTAACSSRPTAARPGSRSTNGCPTSPRTASAASASTVAPSRSEAAVRDRSTRETPRRALSLRRRAARRWTRVTTDERVTSGARRRLRRSQSRSEEPRHRLRREHRRPGSRPTAARRSARSAARRAATTITASGSIPNNPKIDPARVRSGRDHHRQRRRDVELLVQPADRAVLSRQHRQRVPVPRLRRAAGERLGVRGEPRRRRRRSRSATGIRSASKSTATSRPIRSIRTSSTAARSSRFDRRTGQVQRHRARGRCAAATYRIGPHAPVVFSPVDPHVLYFASNTLWKTIERRAELDEISPDLTRDDVGRAGERRQVSRHAGGEGDAARRHLRAGAVAARRRPHLGRHRRRPDPRHARRRQDVEGRDAAGADAVGKVSIIDASHFDRARRVRRDQHDPPRRSAAAHLPHARRRQDVDARSSAASPTARRSTRCAKIRSEGAAVRRHRARRCISRSTTAITGSRCGRTCRRRRSAIWSIKDDDLVVGTHGRGFWILDDITPLRQLGIATLPACISSSPQRALRVRWNMNTDTPLPPDEPAGQNPPDGAVIDYYLAAAAAGPVTLEILDAGGAIVAQLLERATRPSHRATRRTCRRTGSGRRCGCRRRAGHAPLHVGSALCARRRGCARASRLRRCPHDTAARTERRRGRCPAPTRVRLTANGKSVTQPLTVEDGSARQDTGARAAAPVLALEAALGCDRRRG